MLLLNGMQVTMTVQTAGNANGDDMCYAHGATRQSRQCCAAVQTANDAGNALNGVIACGGNAGANGKRQIIR